MPVGAGHDETRPVIDRHGRQLVCYRPMGIEHRLEAHLDAMTAQIGLDVREVRVRLSLQQVFDNFDQRNVLR